MSLHDQTQNVLPNVSWAIAQLGSHSEHCICYAIHNVLPGNVQGYSFSMDTNVNLHTACRGVQHQPVNVQLVIDSFAIQDVAEHTLTKGQMLKSMQLCMCTTLGSASPDIVPQDLLGLIMLL